MQVSLQLVFATPLTESDLVSVNSAHVAYTLPASKPGETIVTMATGREFLVKGEHRDIVNHLNLHGPMDLMLAADRLGNLLDDSMAGKHKARGL